MGTARIVRGSTNFFGKEIESNQFLFRQKLFFGKEIKLNWFPFLGNFVLPKISYGYIGMVWYIYIYVYIHRYIYIYTYIYIVKSHNVTTILNFAIRGCQCDLFFEKHFSSEKKLVWFDFFPEEIRLSTNNPGCSIILCFWEENKSNQINLLSG